MCSDQDKEALRSWNINAALWDEAIGPYGNKYWHRLQQPCLERLLHDKFSAAQPRTPKALEFACGNGLVSRWLSECEAVDQIVATDGSVKMLSLAKGYGDSQGRITFKELNVMDRRYLKLVSKILSGKDILIMNMALMNVADLSPLAEVLPTFLADDGVFVATTLHPVFMTSKYSRNIQYQFDPETGKQNLFRSKAIYEYLGATSSRENIIPEQETPWISYHRSIHELLAPFLKAGLVLDAFEELGFGKEDALPDRPEATSSFTELPCLLAFRLRKVPNATAGK